MNSKNNKTSVAWKIDVQRFQQLSVQDSSYKDYLANTGKCKWFIQVNKMVSIGVTNVIISLEVENIIDDCQVFVTIKNFLRLPIIETYSFNTLQKSREIHRFQISDVDVLPDFHGRNRFIIYLEWESSVSDTFLEQPKTQTPIIKEPVSEKSKLCHLNELSEDFQALLFEEHLSDVTIECHSTVFKAHKLILCTRSPVFKAMFASAMQEAVTDKVTIVDMDTEVLRSMIHFMYSGQIDIHSLDEATSLLDAAEKYQIQSLKKGLIQYMKSNLSEDNVFKLLETADIFDEDLKADALKFFGSHYKILSQRKEWNDLKTSKPTLALEVYSNVEKLLV